MRVLDFRELSECRDVSKLREVLECCEGSESHEVSVCHKVLSILRCIREHSDAVESQSSLIYSSVVKFKRVVQCMNVLS